jgi:AcrR family transcriptional regulator
MNGSFYLGRMQSTPVTPAPQKMSAVVEAAACAFALSGYQRTQMADIAARAHVALGTLYRYASSKEDLFGYALAFGVGDTPDLVAGHMPIRDVEAFFEAHWRRWFAARELEDAFAHAIEPASAFASLYDVIHSRRLTIRIVDRSAHDLPRLAELYSVNVRQPVLSALERYLDEQWRAGAIAPLDDLQASARFALEVCAWFAMHRHFSPGGDSISDVVARRTAINRLAAAFRSIA